MTSIRILLVCCLLSSTAGATDTILSPRTKAEHEADLKALREKYGPARDDAPALTVDRPAAAPVPLAPTPSSPVSPTPTPSRPASPTPPSASAQRIRITLYPDGARGFIYNEERYDTEALIRVLADFGRRERLDSLLLLEREDRMVDLTHVVELAKLGKALKLPTMYQQGSEFKSISAQ